MDEFREWLEKQITEMKESAEYSAKAKFYGAADAYITRANVYKECLTMFNKVTENKGIKFSDLEVGKKYVGIHFIGGKINAFVVIAKGCDSEGQYIWYGDTVNDTVALKSYAYEYETVKYFEEVK